MKNKKLIVIILLLAAGVIYYLMTPKQTRLPDDYESDLYLQEEEISLVPEIPKNKQVDTLVVYTYAATDTRCEEPIAFTPRDMDKRYAYKEINALTTLFNKDSLTEEYQHIFINGTTLNNLRISKGVAYVDVVSFLTLGKDPCGPQSRITLIKKTLEQFEDIETIQILTDGKPLEN